MGTRRYVVRREDFKGAYDPVASYHTGSFVRHGGALWMSLRPVSGVAPAEGADWTRYVEKGDQGIQGVQGIQGIQGQTGRGFNPRGAWVSGTTYAVDDIVTHSGATYRRRVAGAGTTVPGSDATNWEAWALRGLQGVQGIQGVQGPRGYGVLYGARDPLSGDGVDGEFWINTATNRIFGPKGSATSGVWPAGTSLVGPKGDKGDTGSPGAGVPSGGSDGQYIRRTADGSTVWESPSERPATPSEAGFQSAVDKAKLDSLSARAVGVFSAQKSSEQSTVANTTHTKVTFGLEDYDVSGWFDPSTSRYTPQRAGYYFINASVYINPAVADKRVQLFVYKNGVEDAARLAMMHTASSSGLVVGGGSIVYANGSTDYFEIWLWHDFGVNTVSLLAGSPWKFQGSYLGTA